MTMSEKDKNCTGRKQMTSGFIGPQLTSIGHKRILCWNKKVLYLAVDDRNMKAYICHSYQTLHYEKKKFIACKLYLNIKTCMN